MRIVRSGVAALVIVVLAASWVVWAGVALGAAAPADAEWPCFHGPNRDAKSPDKGLLKEWPAGGPPLLWKYEGLGQGFSTVSVSGGMIYTSGDAGGRFTVFALDMDGKLKWKIDHDVAWAKNSNPGARSTPTIDGGNLYIESGDGLVGCYDAKTGAKK